MGRTFRAKAARGTVVWMQALDVLVVGGGVIGQATAYQLLRCDPGLRVGVLERDPTYLQASSGLSVGGVRQQFGTEINIRIARESVRFYERAKEHLGDEAEVGLRQRGYLFLATEANWPLFRSRASLARRNGVPVELLTPQEAGELVPGLSTDDLAGASYCHSDGYLDPQGVLAAFRAAARRAGALQIEGEAVSFARRGAHLLAAMLRGGGEMAAGRFVLAAGAWSAALADPLGAKVPVRALRRQVHLITPPGRAWDEVPLTIDPSGLHFRPESGGRLIVAHATARDGYDLPLQWDRAAFLEELWEPLARRVPAFAALRLERGWAGYYDENVIDHNAIVGRLPGVDNAFLATGFSGHGLMQCPAVTRGVAELMIFGEYRSLDLSVLSLERFARGALIVEPAVI